MCSISVELGAAGKVTYDAFRRDEVELDPPLGRIKFEEVGRELRVTISGDALALRVAAP